MYKNEQHEQDTSKEEEEKEQDLMNDEIKKLVQKSSMRGVANLMRETFAARRNRIKKLDSCSAVVVEFPYLLNAEVVLIELEMMLNIQTDELLTKMEETIQKLGLYFKHSLEDGAEAYTESQKASILRCFFKNFLRKKSGKALDKIAANYSNELFMIHEAYQPHPEKFLASKEHEAPRLIMFKDKSSIVSAFVIADRNIEIKVEPMMTVSKAALCLLATYYAWDSEYPDKYKVVLEFFHKRLFDRKINNNKVLSKFWTSFSILTD